MGLTALTGIGVATMLFVIIFFIIRSGDQHRKQTPYLLSYVALGLMIVNWVLYLLNFYALLPEKIGTLLFLPIWISVSGLSLIAAYKEFKNHRIFALINGGLAVISFIIALLAWGIGKM